MERGNQPEVYQYEQLPIEFRRQVVHIWNTPISDYEKYLSDELWDSIHGDLIRELGKFHIGRDRRAIPSDQLSEMQFPDDAINELNHRFREHAIGYQYNSGQIIRVDSGFIHAEVVIPALRLLSSQDFSGAEQEFLIAHEHYRKQKYKEAITNALKAFESTMKTICSKCGWTYDPNACAKDLIKVVFDNKLLPEYLNTQFSTLKSILESGIPTVRNKTSGHGQGEQPTVVPEYLTAYVLHLTASNIVFLMEAYKSQKSSSK